MEVAVEVSPNNYDSVSSASPDIPPEIRRENGDGDEGWPLPVVAARVDCPDGALDVSEDPSIPSTTSEDSNQPSSTDAVQITPQRKPLPVRTLNACCFCYFVYFVYYN